MDKLVVKNKNELYSYLRDNLNKSKNNIKSLLKNECIYVNDKIVTKYNYIVDVGDIITIGKKINNNDFNLKIIYEDNDIIVIDKPSKILTISNDKEKEKTLYREVSNYLKRENKKVFVIHRLDYDTSGIIIFAKNQKIQKLYQENWNKLAKKREYTAIVEGITNSHGHIESYLKMSRTLQVYSSKNNDGLLAITDYERIKYNDKYDIAYNNLGVIYLDDLGRVNKSIELFRKAVDSNPNYALAHFNLARAISIIGDKVEAAKLYQMAQDINKITQEIDPRDIADKISELFES